MSDLGKKGNLGVVDGVIRTAYADGKGAVVNLTPEQFNARYGNK